MNRISHTVWLVRWLQRLGSALMRRHKVIDLLPSVLAPRQRLLFDRRSGKFRKFKLRRSLSDYWAYDQCLASAGLDLGRHPQGRKLRETYETMLAAGKTPVVLDCGANIGFSSYWLGVEFPRARLIAVEPDIDNAKLAEFNTRDCDNVSVLRAAVASVDCLVDLTNTSGGSDAFRTEISSSGDISGYSIATLLAKFDAVPEDVLFAKIDIEGFEQELFSRNTGWVAAAAAIVVETHDWMLPGQATATHLLRAVSSGERDFLVSGEHIMSFRI